MTRPPTIVTCAVTGNITTRASHPGLPVTPEEITEAALAAARAGAAIVHLHARDPDTGRGSMDLEHYRAAFVAIRRANPGLIVNLTTGEGGRFVPSDDDPRVAAENSTLTMPERRVAHIVALRPEICTLDLNTMWSSQAAVINPPRNVEIMARAIEAAGVKPEIELFDSGDLQLAKYLLHKHVLKAPLMMSLVLGVRFGAPADPATMLHLSSRLPPDTQWTGFGIGRAAFPMLAQSFLLGGHVRIGMEDTVEIEDGKPCRDNAELVAKGVAVIEMLGGTVASPTQAREILGLST